MAMPLTRDVSTTLPAVGDIRVDKCMTTDPVLCLYVLDA